MVYLSTWDHETRRGHRAPPPSRGPRDRDGAVLPPQRVRRGPPVVHPPVPRRRPVRSHPEAGPVQGARDRATGGAHARAAVPPRAVRDPVLGPPPRRIRRVDGVANPRRARRGGGGRPHGGRPPRDREGGPDEGAPLPPCLHGRVAQVAGAPRSRRGAVHAAVGAIRTLHAVAAPRGPDRPPAGPPRPRVSPRLLRIPRHGLLGPHRRPRRGLPRGAVEDPPGRGAADADRGLRWGGPPWLGLRSRPS